MTNEFHRLDPEGDRLVHYLLTIAQRQINRPSRQSVLSVRTKQSTC